MSDQRRTSRCGICLSGHHRALEFRIRAGTVWRSLLVVAACAFVCVSSTPRASGAELGVAPDLTWGIGKGDIVRTVALLKRARVRWVRLGVDLSGAEREGPGRLNPGYLQQIDYAISAVRAAGIQVLMELDRTPYWASADPAKHLGAQGVRLWNAYYRYANPQDYARIAADMVNRYKRMGVHAFELWNEPNFQPFWPSGPDPVQYSALLRAAYPAIKAADPSATVLIAGLETRSAYAFLQGIYDAGGRGYYDAANFHVYPAGDPGRCIKGSDGRPSHASLCLIDGLHAVMAANGDGATPVWVTELGWSTCSQSLCVSERAQATYLTKAYQMLSTRRYAYVRVAFTYAFRDDFMATDPANWNDNLGVLRRDFSPKPAYGALKALSSTPHQPPSGMRRPSGPPTRSVSLSLRRRPHRLSAVGRVSGAGRGQVTLLLARKHGARWASAGRRSVHVSRSGRFARDLRLAAGAWRVRAVYGRASSPTLSMSLR